MVNNYIRINEQLIYYTFNNMVLFFLLDVCCGICGCEHDTDTCDALQIKYHVRVF